MDERHLISIALYSQINLFWCPQLFCFPVLAWVSQEFLKFGVQVCMTPAALSLHCFPGGLSFDEVHPHSLLFLDIDQVFSLHTPQFVMNFQACSFSPPSCKVAQEMTILLHFTEQKTEGQERGRPSGSKYKIPSPYPTLPCKSCFIRKFLLSRQRAWG